jgi:hypothetical protein
MRRVSSFAPRDYTIHCRGERNSLTQKGTSLRTSRRRNHSQILREELVAAWSFRRILRIAASAAAGAAATTAATTAGATTTAAGAAARTATAGTAARAPATLAAAGATRTAALIARAAGTTASAAATTAPGSAGRTADDCRGGPAERVAGAVAEGVDRSNDNDRNANDQKSVFGCILTGFLAPESFEEREHVDDTCRSEGTTS